MVNGARGLGEVKAVGRNLVDRARSDLVVGLGGLAHEVAREALPLALENAREQNDSTGGEGPFGPQRDQMGQSLEGNFWRRDPYCATVENIGGSPGVVLANNIQGRR